MISGVAKPQLRHMPHPLHLHLICAFEEKGQRSHHYGLFIARKDEAGENAFALI